MKCKGNFQESEQSGITDTSSIPDSAENYIRVTWLYFLSGLKSVSVILLNETRQCLKYVNLQICLYSTQVLHYFQKQTETLIKKLISINSRFVMQYFFWKQITIMH